MMTALKNAISGLQCCNASDKLYVLLGPLKGLMTEFASSKAFIQGHVQHYSIKNTTTTIQNGTWK